MFLPGVLQEATGRWLCRRRYCSVWRGVGQVHVASWCGKRQLGHHSAMCAWCPAQQPWRTKVAFLRSHRPKVECVWAVKHCARASSITPLLLDAVSLCHMCACLPIAQRQGNWPRYWTPLLELMERPSLKRTEVMTWLLLVVAASAGGSHTLGACDGR